MLAAGAIRSEVMSSRAIRQGETFSTRVCTRPTVCRIAASFALALCAACAQLPVQTKDSPCEGAPALGARAFQSRLLVLGEIHGTSEVPRIAKDLVCQAIAEKRSPVLLLLELDGSQSPALARYVASDGKQEERCAFLAHFEWARPGQDGRTTVAMFELIDFVRAMKRIGHPVEVAAFAAGTDQQYADNIARQLDQKPQAWAVAVVGNLHAAKQPLTYGGRNIVPAVSLLERYAPVSLNMVASGGTFWGIFDGTQGVHDLDDYRDVGFAPDMLRYGKLSFEPVIVGGLKYDGYFAIGPATASPPGAKLCR